MVSYTSLSKLGKKYSIPENSLTSADLFILNVRRHESGELLIDRKSAPNLIKTYDLEEISGAPFLIGKGFERDFKSWRRNNLPALANDEVQGFHLLTYWLKNARELSFEQKISEEVSSSLLRRNKIHYSLDGELLKKYSSRDILIEQIHNLNLLTEGYTPKNKPQIPVASVEEQKETIFPTNLVSISDLPGVSKVPGKDRVDLKIEFSDEKRCLITPRLANKHTLYLPLGLFGKPEIVYDDSSWLLDDVENNLPSKKEATRKIRRKNRPIHKKTLDLNYIKPKPSEDSRSERELFEDYKSNPSDSLRNLLMERYLEVVSYAAARFHEKLPPEVQLGDLIQEGNFGLFEAIEKYDLSKGIKFETYAAHRVRGKMLDWLRNEDWHPRQVRFRNALFGKVVQKFKVENGIEPTDEQIKDRLNLSQEVYDKLKGDARADIKVGSLSTNIFETDSGKNVDRVDLIVDKSQKFDSGLERKDIWAHLTDKLSRTEKLLLSLYYQESMTMKEIGREIGLSESRVSQMHSSLLDRLHSVLSSDKRAKSDLEDLASD